MRKKKLSFLKLTVNRKIKRESPSGVDFKNCFAPRAELGTLRPTFENLFCGVKVQRRAQNGLEINHSLKPSVHRCPHVWHLIKVLYPLGVSRVRSVCEQLNVKERNQKIGHRKESRIGNYLNI